MSTTTEAVLADLIPLGLVVALSPVSIIPAVLVLHTARPRVSGLAFLAGWLLSIVVMTEIFVGLSVVVGRVEHTPTWAW